MKKAGGSINIFSESTHIEALIKACKIMEIKKKSYLYNPTVYPAYLLTPTSYGEWGPRLARGGRGVIAAFKPRCAVLVVRAVNEDSRRFYCAN